MEIFLAVDNAPPELAVNGAIPTEPQLCQCAWCESQSPGGLPCGQRDRIASRHRSLRTNQPDSPAICGYEQDRCCARTFACNTASAMKKLSKPERTKAWKRFKASIEARRRAKTALINEAKAAEGKEWAEQLWPDSSMDAWFHRKSMDSDFIEKRGGFSRHVVALALTDPDWETKGDRCGLASQRTEAASRSGGETRSGVRQTWQGPGKNRNCRNSH
jgi:hypothetical protein